MFYSLHFSSVFAELKEEIVDKNDNKAAPFTCGKAIFYFGVAMSYHVDKLLKIEGQFAEVDKTFHSRMTESFIRSIDEDKIIMLKSEETRLRSLANPNVIILEFNQDICTRLERIFAFYAVLVGREATLIKHHLEKLTIEKVNEKNISRSELKFDERPSGDLEILERTKLYTIWAIQQQMKIGKNFDSAKKKISELYDLLVKKYSKPSKDEAEQTKVEWKSLAYIFTLNALLHAMDSQTEYLPYKVFKEFIHEIEGLSSGIGVLVRIDNLNKELYIQQVFKDGPAFGKIFPGDRILGIADEDDEYIAFKDMSSISEIITRLRGKKGTNVTVKIARGVRNKEEHRSFTFERKEMETAANNLIEVVSVDDKNIVYIEVSGFVERTAVYLEKNFKKATYGKKIDGIILNLNNNSGGIIDEAIKVADMFLDKGVVYYIKTKEFTKTEYAQRNGELAENAPMIVMLNELSASASELVCWGSF